MLELGHNSTFDQLDDGIGGKAPSPDDNQAAGGLLMRLRLAEWTSLATGDACETKLTALRDRTTTAIVELPSCKGGLIADSRNISKHKAAREEGWGCWTLMPCNENAVLS